MTLDTSSVAALWCGLVIGDSVVVEDLGLNTVGCRKVVQFWFFLAGFCNGGSLSRKTSQKTAKKWKK
jgi:hypothetical protein